MRQEPLAYRVHRISLVVLVVVVALVVVLSVVLAIQPWWQQIEALWR